MYGQGGGGGRGEENSMSRRLETGRKGNGAGDRMIQKCRSVLSRVNIVKCVLLHLSETMKLNC